ncbi:glutathione S-transferase family protein [Stappia sp. BW2]|uniref:glutathione S-transferase family protein n=1 Tax=Stappia sp. BW2 TaxID=2592622 RepID=UPI001396774F|nr:glutathione S-transferase family protein [Stappia sp. BW2]
MLTLFSCIGTASFAPQMVLEEAELMHNIVEIDISRGAHRSPEYLSINPSGKIPALKLENGTVMTEASAICLFLADLHQLSEIAPGPSDPDRPLFLKTLIYLATSVQDQYKRYYYPERYSTDASNAQNIRDRAVELLGEVWAPLEEHLDANGPYCLGPRHSVADTYLVMLASWYPDQDGFRHRFPSIARCFDLVAERPIIKAGLDRQHVISVGRKDAGS